MANKKDETKDTMAKTPNLDDDLKIFNEAIGNLKDTDKVNIILHNTPDPDAISCGWAVKTILGLRGIKSEMYHFAEVSHMQNIAMNNIFHIPLTLVNEPITEGVNICVDCTPKNSCVEEAYLIIDHHENNPDAEFVINHPNFGACATIVWNITKNIIKDMSEHKPLASALLIGVRTDTKDMSSENISESDFEAWKELYKYSDKEKVQKIMNYDYPRYYFEKMVELNKAGNIKEKDGTLVGGVGFCASNQKDVIAMLADDYLRQEGTNSTIIFCITDKKYIDISMRTKTSTINVGNFLKKLFNEFAGGTSYQGGARIPIDNFFGELEEDLLEQLWNIVCTRIFRLTITE